MKKEKTNKTKAKNTEVVSRKDKIKKIEDKKKNNKIKGSIKRKFIIFILICLIAIASVGLVFTIYIIASSPEFDVNKLYKSGSSIIYDKDMNVIAELGSEKRDNVTYDELPDVLIDAIVATEDSKFFQHSGIDLLRFSKAAAGQLLGHSDAGGGSTLTMQIVKNTYNGTVSSGISGIVRKFKDIYMAVFKVEKTYTKQEIIEFYVNQAYLGSSSYGVEQASQTYFGKSSSELNLAEASTLAGLFQAPSAYDPFLYPEKAEARRNLVLSLMVRHNYITEEEAEIAKQIHVKDLLYTGKDEKITGYQGFVDTVVADVYKKTGNDPYKTSMTIYSTMVKSKQDVINKLYAGDIYKWKNDVVQCGIAVTSSEDGSVVAVGTGRNRVGELTYNYATNIKRHPGSTAKPIFDYGPAIEYSGWGTGTVVVDDVYKYTSGQELHNVDHSYYGMMTAKTALANSRNIPALQAFKATTQEQKLEFVKNLGITPELHNGLIYESSAIGAFNGVSPLELSAAYGAFSRGGYYIEPYAFTKIVYNDTKETFTYTPTKKKAMSEETAFMINMILKYAVTSGIISAGSVSGTDIASKTGTSSVDSGIAKKLGLSDSAIGDIWQAVYSPDYAIAFWYGYDSLSKDNYLTSNEGWTARRQIATALSTRIMEKNSTWTKPSGVTSVTVELETSPTLLASSFTPSNLKSTEYYKKGTEPTEVSPRFSQLANVTNLTYSTSGNKVELKWSPIKTPDAINSSYLQNYFDKNFKEWSSKYYHRRLNYNASNIGTLVYDVYAVESSGGLTYLGSTASSSFTVSVSNASSATFLVKSAYSIYKANASSGASVTARVDYVPLSPTPPDNQNPTTPEEKEPVNEEPKQEQPTEQENPTQQ